MIANDIISACRDLLADNRTERLHWSDAEMYRWIHEGQSQIITKVPYANSDSNYRHNCSVGASQRLVGRAWMILEVHGLVVDGVVATALDRIERKDADRGTPGWQSERGEPCEYIMHEPGQGETRNFWLLPGADQSYQVELSVSLLPVQVNAINQELDLNDEWLHVLTDFCMYRLLSKAHKEGNTAIATGYQRNFLSGIGMMSNTVDDDPEDMQKRRKGYVR